MSTLYCCRYVRTSRAAPTCPLGINRHGRICKHMAADVPRDRDDGYCFIFGKWTDDICVDVFVNS